jgi:3-hydroxyisobutyrate dehydrogenase
VFGVLGRKAVWVGEAGQGRQMKPVVNAYTSILIEGAAEAVALADWLGSATRSWRRSSRAPAGRSDRRRHAPQDGPGRLCAPNSRWSGLKDLGLVLGVTSRGPLPPLGALSRQWHPAVDAGLRREDISAVRLALQSAGYR